MKFTNKTITINVIKTDLNNPQLIGIVDGTEYRLDPTYAGGRDFLRAVFDSIRCNASICSEHPEVKIGDTWVTISPPPLPRDPKLLPEAVFNRLKMLKSEALRLADTYTVSETKDLDQLDS